MYTWVDEKTIQRLFQEICRGHFGGVSDYLGVPLEVFWNEFVEKTQKEKAKKGSQTDYLK